MTNGLSLPIALLATGSLVAGLLVGFAFFVTLATTVRLLAEGRALAAGMLQVGRFAAMAAALIVAAELGALPLICGALGIVFGRHLVMRRNRVARS